MARQARILIVDDDPAVRDTVAELLSMAGFDAIAASDALQAVMILRQDPEVDLLVTDLSMPGADGIVLIRQARAIKPAMPAILLTGNPEEAQSHAQAASGSFQVLGKPVESERLTRQIDLLLSGDVHPADNIALK